MQTPHIQAGSIVRLNSGSYDMTVEDITPCGSTYKCNLAYFERGELHRVEGIKICALTLIPKSVDDEAKAVEASANAVCHEADQILQERGRRLTLQEKVVEIGNVLADSQQEVVDLRAKRDQLEAENKQLLDSAHAKSEECSGLVNQVIELRSENARLREALSKVPLFRMTEDALGWECCGCGAVAGITESGKDRNEPCKPGCYVDIVEAALANTSGKEGA